MIKKIKSEERYDLIKKLESHYTLKEAFESEVFTEDILNEVYPNKGESKKDFIARFMKVTKDEYPDIKQRYAVALSYWNRRKKKVLSEEDEFDMNEFISLMENEIFD